MTITYGDVRAHVVSAPREKESSGVRIFLAQQSVMSVKPIAAGSTVRCWSGKVWVTQAGDAMDYFLSAGDTFPMARSGQVVIEAMEEAMVSVSE